MRWVCAGCGCLYAAGAPACPECRATGHTEEEMPKITVAGGASNALGQDPEETPDPTPGPVPDSAPEPSSPESSAPAEEPEPEPAPAPAKAPKPAPKSG